MRTPLPPAVLPLVLLGLLFGDSPPTHAADPSAPPSASSSDEKPAPAADTTKKSDKAKSEPARKRRPSSVPAHDPTPASGAATKATAPNNAATSRSRPAQARPEPVRAAPETRVRADARAPAAPAAARSRDHRYARPGPYHLPPAPAAHNPPPGHGWYRAWYTHWWVHPWYRWTHATAAVIWFDYRVDAWVDTWTPPARAGWVWVSGHWEGSMWVPGHWAPAFPAPGSWVYVPGFWAQGAYVEGYWRVTARPGWVWVDTVYHLDHSCIWGHWRPEAVGPVGYLWEPGFWDGAGWVEGFWRPERRPAYHWVDADYGADGVFHAGYWEPTQPRTGYVWVPGWFDGWTWQPGYWVTKVEYDTAKPDEWTPDPGWDGGWDAEGQAPSTGTGEEAAEGEDTIAIPVTPP